jgi:hypothetical protein
MGGPEVDTGSGERLRCAPRTVFHTAKDRSAAQRVRRRGRQMAAQSRHVHKYVVVGFHHEFRLQVT